MKRQTTTIAEELKKCNDCRFSCKGKYCSHNVRMNLMKDAATMIEQLTTEHEQDKRERDAAIHNEKKVLCPWCGEEMELKHLGADDCEAFIYACKECGASSPMKSSGDEALQAALARPLQKPLTLEEATERKAVWLDIGEVFPAVMSHDSDEVFCHFYYDKGNYFSDKTKMYGKSWRCWATKPTDDERKAAKWE